MAQSVNTRSTALLQKLRIDKIYFNSGSKVPPLYQSFFNDYAMDPKYSYFQAIPVIGFGTAKEVVEGATTSIDQFTVGKASEWPLVEFGLKYNVTRLMREEDPQGIVPKLPERLRYAIDQTKERLAWAPMNLAFSSNAVGADNQPLISANHPLLGSSSRPGITSNSNLLPFTSLTADTLNQATILMYDMLDDRGLEANHTPETLLVPLGAHQAAREALGAEYYHASNENRKNVAYESLNIMVSRYLLAPAGGPFQWFVTCGKGEPGEDAHSIFFNEKWTRMRSWVDENTETMSQESKFRYTSGWIDYRGIIGSQGA